MKKIFTLLILLGAVVAVRAQSSSRPYPNDRYNSRDVILGDRNDGRYENNRRYTYSFTARERDQQLDRINRSYDQRIRQVERDRRMRSYERNAQIRRLEEQRRDEIRQVWEHFRSSNNLQNDNRYPSNRRG